MSKRVSTALLLSLSLALPATAAPRTSPEDFFVRIMAGIKQIVHAFDYTISVPKP